MQCRGPLPSDTCGVALPQLLVQGGRLIAVSHKDKGHAVALRILCGRYDVALHWIRVQQLRQWKWRAGLAEDVTTACLQSWETRMGHTTRVSRILSKRDCKARLSLEKFVAEFHTQGEVQKLHARGLRVPSAHVLHLYCRSLTAQDPGHAGLEHVASLREKKSRAKKWSAGFRSRWLLEWGGGHVLHGLHRSDQTARTVVYLRWARWVLHDLRGAAEPLVVNMDETQLSNVKARCTGVVANARRAAESPATR